MSPKIQNTKNDDYFKKISSQRCKATESLRATPGRGGRPPGFSFASLAVFDFCDYLVVVSWAFRSHEPSRYRWLRKTSPLGVIVPGFMRKCCTLGCTYMWVCMYVCVCMFACMCMYVCICVYICTRVYMYIRIYVYTCMYIYIYVYVYMCMYACLYVYMYMMHMCIYV